jgi:S-adenosylmethionine:tRNA ribosyltransferase-isomerase
VLIDPAKIQIGDYSYDLPPGRISQYPLNERDESKLLIFRDGKIRQSIFRDIADYLPRDSLMILNDTRVFHARLLFTKPTGSVIEVFCLEPVMPVHEITTAFQQKSPVEWHCLIGHARRWKGGLMTAAFDFLGKEYTLSALRITTDGEHTLVKLSWDHGDLTFAQVIEACGKIPLPPYINRQAEKSDELRYQTIFAIHEGSIAAPTAGLHYTENVLNSLAARNIHLAYLTLHVGAGTFKPVTHHAIENHQMHREKITVPINLIHLLSERPSEEIIAVGTTTVRTLESLYWFGVKLLSDHGHEQQMEISQWEPYQYQHTMEIPVREALTAVIGHCRRNHTDHVEGYTQLMIVPGYQYRIPGIMVSNFHQPKSTLLLLVAAFIGDEWKTVYDYALKHGFRFLSYGDSCLFYRKR